MSVLDQCNVRNGGGAGAPLVFGHGFGTDQRAWRYVAPAFGRSHRVVTFDHVGFGGSDPGAYDERRHATLDGYADDVTAIVGALDLHDVTYVGHSAGGIIGMLASLAPGSRISRLVLLGASPRFIDDPPYVGGFSREDIEGILDLIERDQSAWADAIVPAAMGEQADDAEREAFGAGLRSLDPLVARRFGRLVFAGDARDKVGDVRVPTLVVQCVNDSLVPREVGRWLSDRISQSRLVELDASGHCPHLTHPRETVAAIEAFIGGGDVVGG